MPVHVKTGRPERTLRDIIDFLKGDIDRFPVFSVKNANSSVRSLSFLIPNTNCGI
jgi:hypothetical protein